MKPRLFLAEDHASIRQMFLFLAQSWKFAVLGDAGDGEETLRQCERLKPTLLVADLSMPKMGGVALLREIRRRKWGIQVLIYTGAMDMGALMEAVAEEPEGFVLKEEDLPVLRKAVQALCDGGSYWSPMAGDLKRRRSAAMCRLGPLTKAEMEVLAWIAVGLTNSEIASKLHRAPDTVKHQRQSIMNKLDMHDAGRLAALAKEAGVARMEG